MNGLKLITLDQAIKTLGTNGRLVHCTNMHNVPKTYVPESYTKCGHILCRVVPARPITILKYDMSRPVYSNDMEIIGRTIRDNPVETGSEDTYAKIQEHRTSCDLSQIANLSQPNAPHYSDDYVDYRVVQAASPIDTRQSVAAKNVLAAEMEFRNATISRNRPGTSFKTSGENVPSAINSSTVPTTVTPDAPVSVAKGDKGDQK